MKMMRNSPSSLSLFPNQHRKDAENLTGQLQEARPAMCVFSYSWLESWKHSTPN